MKPDAVSDVEMVFADFLNPTALSCTAFSCAL